MTPTKPRLSDSTDTIGAPRNREVALSCAYLRLLGSSQVEAAKATGIDPRTLGRWESCSWWPDVQAEAGERWLHGCTAKARRALLNALDEADGVLALKYLERVIPELAPATQEVGVKGMLAKLDFSRLPLPLLKRIAAGEHPLQVLASASEGVVEKFSKPKRLPPGPEEYDGV